jgi:hypothetical protein
MYLSFHSNNLQRYIDKRLDGSWLLFLSKYLSLDLERSNALIHVGVRRT